MSCAHPHGKRRLGPFSLVSPTTCDSIHPRLSGEEFVMRIVSRLLLAALACVAFSATSFAGGPFGMIRVGKWQGAAYTTAKGAFSHCTAAAKFDSGRAIILAQNA